MNIATRLLLGMAIILTGIFIGLKVSASSPCDVCWNELATCCCSGFPGVCGLQCDPCGSRFEACMQNNGCPWP